VSLGLCHAVVVCMCVCRISLGSEGNVLYPVLSSSKCCNNVLFLCLIFCFVVAIVNIATAVYKTDIRMFTS